jgi:hypothetical protein
MDPLSKISKKNSDGDLIKIGTVYKCSKNECSTYNMLAKCFEIKILRQNSYINLILFLS